ncbi:MAG: hypothetical protein EOP42_10275 [Sphingobacteriaceae bacterium]|nr:MAG: hypothetical protein EOP42_10275 [Sphingobacteriaceae bacterium]
MKPTLYTLTAFLFLLFNLAIEMVYAQNIGISSASNFTPDASAGLDISYANKGLLIPRVALSATNVASPVTSPAISLLVYNTATTGTSPFNVIPGYYYWNGTLWVMLNSSSTQSTNLWSTTGNIGTSYKNNFLGTADNNSLRFRTNNMARAIVDSLGNVGIGSETFDPENPEKLMIDAGTTTSNTLISGSGSINSFLQFNIQNVSNGTAASTDIVATANNGTDNGAYIDMGINSAGYTTTSGVTGITTKPITAYLYANAGDMVIGNGATNKPLIFFTNSAAAGTVTPNGSERMRIDGPTGNVGIGTITPSATLHLKAGTATAKTAPLKFTSGTNLATPEAGAVEFDGINYFITSGTTRYTLAKTLTATATLDFPNTTNTSGLTVTVTGVTDGDVILLGVPSAAILANCSYYGYVSAANTVNIMLVNSNTLASVNPSAGIFRICVLKY